MYSTTFRVIYTGTNHAYIASGDSPTALRQTLKEHNFGRDSKVLTKEILPITKNVNKVDEFGNTPLYSAIREHLVAEGAEKDELFKAIEALLSSEKIDINEGAPNKNPLFYALETGQENIVRKLLTHKKLRWNVENEEGHNYLYSVLVRMNIHKTGKDIAIAKLLIEHMPLEQITPDVEYKIQYTHSELYNTLEQKKQSQFKRISLLNASRKVFPPVTDSRIASLRTPDQQEEPLLRRDQTPELPPVKSAASRTPQKLQALDITGSQQTSSPIETPKPVNKKQQRPPVLDSKLINLQKILPDSR